jgi:hypothetical protein
MRFDESAAVLGESGDEIQVRGVPFFAAPSLLRGTIGPG